MVGDALLAAQDYAGADQCYRRALELAQSLSKDDPLSLQKRIDVYVLIAKLASANERGERFDDAANWYERARANARDSAKAGFITQAQQTELDRQNATFQAVCRQAKKALDQPAWIAAQPGEMARPLWGVRALTLARRGQVGMAAESAETLRRLAPDDVVCLVVVARAFSLCERAASDASAKKTVTAQSEPSAFAEKAIDSLERAFQIQPDLARNGWLESDFDPLYSFPEYRRLIAQSVAQRAGH